MAFDPQCELVAEPAWYTKVDLRGVRYDPNAEPSPPLVLDLSSASHGDFFLTFADCYAFRVIDEGQVTEFWNTYSTPNGWLWLVQSGGWFELESLRDTFWLADVAAPEYEYLIVGYQCVFVLTSEPPQFVAGTP